MSDTAVMESNIEFKFPDKHEKLDSKVPFGLMSVDFAVYFKDYLCLIEVKNYENPKTTLENKKRDYKRLTDPDSAFPLEIGMKIKDTLLRKFSEGCEFDKPIIFLLVTKLDSLEPNDRLNLYEKIRGYIPTGLNGNSKFQFGIKFDMPTFEELSEKYGINATLQN
jgi:hypothetical protein